MGSRKRRRQLTVPEPGLRRTPSLPGVLGPSHAIHSLRKCADFCPFAKGETEALREEVASAGDQTGRQGEASQLTEPLLPVATLCGFPAQFLPFLQTREARDWGAGGRGDSPRCWCWEDPGCGLAALEPSWVQGAQRTAVQVVPRGLQALPSGPSPDARPEAPTWPAGRPLLLHPSCGAANHHGPAWTEGL